MNESTATLSDFWAAWELFRTPALAGTVAGVLLGYLGVYVVLRKMVFLSAALAQSAGFGVALAFFARLRWGLSPTATSPTLWATGSVLLSSWLPLSNHPKLAMYRDRVLGGVFLLGMSGTLLLGAKIVQELQDIKTLLFGTSVVVSEEHFTNLCMACAVILPLHIWWMRGLTQATLDPEGARVRRLPVGVLNAVVLVSVALSIAGCTRVLGALPVFALCVLPAMAVGVWARNTLSMFLVSALLGGACAFVGYICAFLYETPVGATQAAVALGSVVLSVVAHTLFRAVQTAMKRTSA